MLGKLYAIEAILPDLLKDDAGWQSVFADSEKPHLKRMWRQLNAAVQEAMDRDGNVNGGVLAFQLNNIALASLLDAKEAAGK